MKTGIHFMYFSLQIIVFLMNQIKVVGKIKIYIVTNNQAVWGTNVWHCLIGSKQLCIGTIFLLWNTER